MRLINNSGFRSDSLFTQLIQIYISAFSSKCILHISKSQSSLYFYRFANPFVLQGTFQLSACDHTEGKYSLARSRGKPNNKIIIFKRFFKINIIATLVNNRLIFNQFKNRKLIFSFQF